MRLNEAANNWRALERVDGSQWPEAMRTPEGGAVARGCADDLDGIAQTAWHSISEPPEEVPFPPEPVVIWHDLGLGVGSWEIAHPGNVESSGGLMWAWMTDVLLLPQGAP